ncbi:MAG: pyridoxamine 5'-phosphate oxidase family protein [Clostridia bacterium]|nr:pyridoxamine 5'-phosphate oxidase family protein [Clostridia bacterium]
MFREMIRKNRQLSEEECIEILKNEKRGVISVLGDDDYPYGTPMNHFYNEEDGNVYFHCGNIGHRLEALRRHDKASFCAFDEGVRQDGDWALTIRSVIVLGRIEIIDDMDTIADITTKLSRKFTDDEAYIQKEVKDHGKRTLLLKLSVEHMCGKKVHEA